MKYIKSVLWRVAKRLSLYTGPTFKQFKSPVLNVLILLYPQLCNMLYHAQSSKSLHATAGPCNVTARSKVFLKKRQSFSDAKTSPLCKRPKFYCLFTKACTWFLFGDRQFSAYPHTSFSTRPFNHRVTSAIQSAAAHTPLTYHPYNLK